MVIGRKEKENFFILFLPLFYFFLVSSAIVFFCLAISCILFILDIVVTKKLVNIPAIKVIIRMIARELFTSQLRK